MKQVTMENGQECWSFGSTQYVRVVVENVEKCLGKKGEKLSTKSLTPLSSKYRPEVDISLKLADEEASYYQYLIGSIGWIVELVHADFFVNVSMMSSHLALPRRGHVDEVFHMLEYLKGHANSEMVYYPSGIEFDRCEFPIKYWSCSIYTQYGCELSENLLPNIPKPHVKGMV